MVLALACSDKGGDTAKPPAVIDSVDTDGDGLLTTADLEVDQAGVYFALTTDDAVTWEQAAVGDDVALSPGDGGQWYLLATLPTQPAVDLTLLFDNTGDMVEMAGAVGHASLRWTDGSGGRLAFATEPAASVEVSNVSSYRATGMLTGAVTLDVVDTETDDPTGETVELRAAAFRGIFFGE